MTFDLIEFRRMRVASLRSAVWRLQDRIVAQPDRSVLVCAYDQLSAARDIAAQRLAEDEIRAWLLSLPEFEE